MPCIVVWGYDKETVAVLNEMQRKAGKSTSGHSGLGENGRTTSDQSVMHQEVSSVCESIGASS